MSQDSRNKQIIIPNGKVNREYSFVFDLEDLSEGMNVTFEGLEAVGLQYCPTTRQITGTPTQAGNHKIQIRCEHKDTEENKVPLEREFTLIINPDPRSLWNNIPTPQDIPYYKPDSEKEFFGVRAKTLKKWAGLIKKEIPRKDMTAASQRGRSHAHEGRPRDDDFGLFFDEETEWYVMTVADGAGSAKYSREGSRIACQTVIDVCTTELAVQRNEFESAIHAFNKEQTPEKRKKVGDSLYTIIGKAAFTAHKKIKEEAEKKENPIKDYSTTLILSICKKFDYGWFVGAFWVGDGGIGIYRKEPPFLKVLGEPDGGEFAGQTRFLTMSEIMQPTELFRRLRFDIVPDFTAVILMTDGITDPKFETDAGLGKIEKWDALWEDLSQAVDFSDDNEQSAEQLLTWLDFWSQGNHDDRTIAILY